MGKQEVSGELFTLVNCLVTIVGPQLIYNNARSPTMLARSWSKNCCLSTGLRYCVQAKFPYCRLTRNAFILFQFEGTTAFQTNQGQLRSISYFDPIYQIFGLLSKVYCLALDLVFYLYVLHLNSKQGHSIKICCNFLRFSQLFHKYSNLQKSFSDLFLN